jgi:hypothetical protein
VRFWGEARRLLYTERVSRMRAVCLLEMRGVDEATPDPDPAARHLTDGMAS